MKRLTGVLSAALALGLAVSGCSNSLSADGRYDTSKIKVDDALAAKLPASIKSSKKIRVGTNPEYAPIEMLGKDGKTPEGVDIDLLNATMAKFGVTVDWQAGPFDSLIAGIEAKKYDAGASAFTIKKERTDKVNMVSYFTAGVRWAVKKGNPAKFDHNSVCGKKVSVQTGTFEEQELLPELSKACGDKKIDVMKFDTQNQASEAVVSGRVDATVADSPVIDYGVKMSGDKLEPQGDMYDSAPYGFIVPKDQGDFASAIADALAQLKKDGTYDEILKKWGVESGGLNEFKVNPV